MPGDKDQLLQCSGTVRVLELFNHEEFIITKLKLHKPPPPLPFLSAFDSLRPDRQGRTTMYRYFFLVLFGYHIASSERRLTPTFSEIFV